MPLFTPAEALSNALCAPFQDFLIAEWRILPGVSLFFAIIA